MEKTRGKIKLKGQLKQFLILYNSHQFLTDAIIKHFRKTKTDTTVSVSL